MNRKEVIVCIDDEEGVLRVLRAQLGARFGHEAQVLTARSGDEAVALFDELNQVWTNLIQNAAQAIEGHGTITIETAEEMRGERDGVVVRIVDDGPGVPEDVLPRIFEPFFTTKPKGEGTGLGLGIARQIVDKHGGELRCESRPGRTMFEVRLPILIEGISEGRA